MEIMTTWNTEFEFDLQRFASSASSIDFADLQKLIDDGSITVAANDKVYWNGSALAYWDADGGEADPTTASNLLATATGATALTLAAICTNVTVGGTTDWAVTAGAATSISKSTNSVGLETGKGATIDANAATLTLTAINNASATKVVGDVVLPADTSVDLSTATSSVTYGGAITSATTIKISDDITLNTSALATGAKFSSDGKVVSKCANNDLIANGDVTAKSGAALAGNATITFVKGGVSGVTGLTGAETVTVSTGAAGKGGTLGTGNVAVATAGVTPTVVIAATTTTATGGVFSELAASTAITASTADVVAGKVTFKNNTPAGINAVGTYTSDTSFKLTTGVVSVAATVTGEISVTKTAGEQKFTNASNTNALELAVTAGDVLGVYTGSSVKGVGGQTYNAIYVNAGALTAGDNVVVTSGTVEVGSAAGGQATVTGLDAVGETVTINDVTGSDANTRTFKVVDVSSSLATVAVTSKSDGKTNYYTASTTNAWDDQLSGATLVTAKDITTSAWTTGTTYFTAIGTPTSTVLTDPGAKLEVNGTTKTLTVYKALDTTSVKVDLSKDSTVNVVDKGTEVKYVVESGANLFTAQGRSFTVTDGVVTASDGTIALDAAANKFVAQGTVNVDATAPLAVTPTPVTPVITYNTGADISGAKITLSSTKYLTLTENNSGSSAENTVIDLTNAKITGVDGDATITTSGVTTTDIGTIKTTGSGTFTFNKTSCVVANDSDGVEFGLIATDVVGTATGLDQDATITISSKLSDVPFSVNGTVFTHITGKNGAVFTGANAAKSAATVTLFAKNDTATVSIGAPATNYVFEVEAMGSANDGIVIGQGTLGTLGALNDGDKVKVYTGTWTEGTTPYYEYEVNGNIMVKTYFNGTAYTTTTYTLSDSSDTGFTVGAAYGGTTINGDEGTKTETATFGTAAGGQKTTSSLTDGVFVNSDGSLTTSDSKAVAKIGLENDVVTYTSQSSKAQVVNVTASSDNWNVTTGTGKDVISFAGAAVTDVKSDININAAAGDDNINFAGSGDAVINAGEGKDTVVIAGSGDVQVSLGAGNDTITATGSGDFIVYGESGNNLITATNATGSVSIAGGSGNDTIRAKSADDVVYGGDGKDVFDITSKSVTISDYTFENDVVYVGATAFSVTDEGKVSAGGKTADISATAGDFYTAQINVGATKSQNWAWAKDGGSNIDLTSYEKDAHIQGDGDGANVLYGGTGDDYIYSYAEKDSVYGGVGKDAISLDTSSSATGRVVGVATTSGKDTVSGFKTGFSDADSLFLVDGTAGDVKASFDATKKRVTFKDGSGSMQMESISAGKSGAVELNVAGTKLAVLGEGAKATVDSASYADVFYGSDSIVDFSAVDEALSVNLSNSLAAGGEGTKFVGISSVIGGKGDNTLMGSAKADSIVAGTGKSSLYGGAGSDTLVGNSTESTVFFFGEGTNTNTISNFQTADKETADTVKIIGNVASAKFANNAIELGTTDGSKAVIKSLVSGSITANTMVKVESDNFTGVAKIGSSSAVNNFTYDSTVGYYGGGSASDKISVTSNFADNAQVWLDGSQGTAYASIDTLDFSNGTGNYILAGDSSKQTIVGGKGENSLWGGTGNVADSIKGGTGTNTFFYGMGEGNDTISSSNAEDTVNLYTVKLSDIDIANSAITNSGVTLALNDGNKLTVATSRDINFTVDGTSWTAVHNSKEWKQNS